MRNDYQVDDWQVHNEPDLSSQGWVGTIEEYYQFVEYTNDAIQYVYATYLPGRTATVLAPVSHNTGWIDDALINVGQSFNAVDFHTYNPDWTAGARIP